MSDLRAKKLLLDFDSMASGICPGADSVWVNKLLSKYGPEYGENFRSVQREILQHLDSLVEGGSHTEVYCASNRQSCEIDRDVTVGKIMSKTPTGSAYIGLERLVAEVRPEWTLNKHLLADALHNHPSGSEWASVTQDDAGPMWRGSACPIPGDLKSPMGAKLKVALVLSQIKTMDPEQPTDIHFVDDVAEYGMVVSEAFEREQADGNISQNFSLKSWVVYWQGMWNDKNNNSTTEPIREVKANANT